MMNVIRLYQNAYKRRPLLTHALETGLIMTSGDVISQTFMEKRDLNSIDVFRSLRFGAIGMCLVAPGRVAWYKVLELKLPGQSLRTVAQKVVLDQLCIAPCFVFVNVSSASLANGMSANQVCNKLQNCYIDIIFNNWKVWPCAQLCNFYFVPPHLRMSFVQVVALLWNIYLSWKANTNN